MTYTLILLRHGESTWNAENLFTGWTDVPLSEKGLAEAQRGGEQLRDAGILPDVVHTSLLRRAISTAACKPLAVTPTSLLVDADPLAIETLEAALREALEARGGHLNSFACTPR